MAREILTDEQWELIRPLLPPQRPKTGRPSRDPRTVVEAILCIDRTGAPWHDLPVEFGPWQSIATRFYRWVEAGVWDHVLEELQRQADASGELDWNLHHVDGTSVRAHQHAAGASLGVQKGEESITHQRPQKKIRKQGKLSGGAGEDSPPRYKRSSRRRQRQTHNLPDHCRTASRAERLRGTDGTRSHKAREARTTTDTSREGSRRQGLLLKREPTLPAGAEHRSGDRPSGR